MDPERVPINKKGVKLQQEVRRTRRGSEGVVGRNKRGRREARGSSQGRRWFADGRGIRQHKNHACRNGGTGFVAAGKRAVDNSFICVVLAVHLRFARWYLSRDGFIRFRVSMRHAHAAFAAGHSIVMPCRSLQGCPERHNGEQTYPRSECSSRSARNVERTFHG
jgi:hypothetical protein